MESYECDASRYGGRGCERVGGEDGVEEEERKVG